MNRTKRRLAILLICMMSFGMFFSAFIEPVFARDGPKIPTVELNISGEKSKGGPIFDTAGEICNGLWAPGITNGGTIRIHNNYSGRVSIHNLGMKMKLYNTLTDEEVSDENLIEEFAEAMKLTIKKGKSLIFESTIYNKSFYEMLYNSDISAQNGYDLGILNWVNIRKDAYVDLEYTVHMDEGAGNNLQGLKASVDFIINSRENPDKDLSDDVDDDKDKKKRKSSLIEEPLEVIPDISGHWAHDCILALIEHDILDPDSNGSIRPEDYITRAEAAVLMARALKLEESKDIGTGYIDTLPASARGYIISATKAGVFKGYPGKVFKPFIHITREEMTAVLIRAFRKDSTTTETMSFKDNGSIAGWAYGNVAAAVKDGIITGYESDNTFRPRAFMTRAEAFTIVCKLLGYHDGHSDEQ